MKLSRIRLQNFRQHAETTVVFDRGLTGIIGPNGSGKTTILEAIAWALYGNQAARGSRDTIRSLRAAPAAKVRVELEFELGPHRYYVDRGLTSAQVFLDGASAPIANGILAVGEFLQRRLGMTRSEFFNTYFTGQKELNVMAAMGPAERAQFLSRVLGYERLTVARQLIRERRKLISAEMNGLRTGMPDADAILRQVSEANARLSGATTRLADAERQRATAGEALLALRPRWETAQREREHLQEILGELRVAESEEQNSTRNLERVDRDLEETRIATAELTALAAQLQRYPGLVAELQQLEALAREEGRRATLVETERALSDELAKLRERALRIESAPMLELEVAAELKQKRAEFEALERELEESRTVWVRDRQEAETKRDELRRTYTELKEQRDRIASLGEMSPCPVCTRPLGKSYRTVLDDLDERLETAVVDGRYFTSRLEQLKAMPEPLQELEDRRKEFAQSLQLLERKLLKVQAAVQERLQLARDIEDKGTRHQGVVSDLAAIPVGYDEVRHREVRRDVERLTPLDARAARVSALVEREPHLRRERDDIVSALAGVRQRLEGLRARRDLVQMSDDEFAALRMQHERAAADLRAMELAAVTATADVASAREAVDAAAQAQKDLAEMELRFNALGDDKRLHDELDRAYTDLRTDLNFALRPELSELASSFLTDLTDGRYTEIELGDQYNVIVLEDGVPKPVISGGEEDLANLVLRLAISQMIAERAGQSFSLLILDEVFGSLDEARRHNVVDLLRRLQDRFEQVILITHIEGVREGLDRVISVRYDEENGTSMIEQPAADDSDANPPFLGGAGEAAD